MLPEEFHPTKDYFGYFTLNQGLEEQKLYMETVEKQAEVQCDMLH